MTERIDKWLWHIRLYKTRSLAATACKSKKVSINSQTTNKSSYQIKPGDQICIKFAKYTKTVEVINFPRRRVGAKLVEEFLKDHTPTAEYIKKEFIDKNAVAYRERGAGRPTKRDRRLIEKTRDFKKD